ncbi:MAG: lumazine-binding family protein [Deltaproteobacteria bacterium]|jgi:hypothetical protein|nr:lumazine-binding family protein [Deltaproteobacteria bacterium]
MDARVSALLDKQEIEEVVLRYCRGIDRRDLDAVRTCYHPDATDQHGSFSGSVDQYIEWVDGLTARYRFTMHYVSNLQVEFGDEPNIAACETYGISLHRSEDPRPFMNLATGFRYLDRFERRDSAWKIAARVAVGEWSIRLPEQTWWEIPESHETGRRDPSDALYALLSSIRAGTD